MNTLAIEKLSNAVLRLDLLSNSSMTPTVSGPSLMNEVAEYNELMYSSASSLALSLPVETARDGTGFTPNRMFNGGNTTTPSSSDAQSLLFDKLVSLKVETSKVAMHLEMAWRSGLFRQLDTLLDEENWDFSDQLPTSESFATFLRLLLLLGRPRRPGLGATSEGNIIAAWTVGRNRLTIECLPADQVRWVASRTLEGGPASGAGRCVTIQLPKMLAPYQPEIWFDAHGVYQ